MRRDVCPCEAGGRPHVMSVCEEALAVELKLRGIPYRRQVPIAVQDNGFSVGEGPIDLLVDGALVVELKAVGALPPPASRKPGPRVL